MPGLSNSGHDFDPLHRTPRAPARPEGMGLAGEAPPLCVRFIIYWNMAVKKAAPPRIHMLSFRIPTKSG
jgi:hypothetical protein